MTDQSYHFEHYVAGRFVTDHDAMEVLNPATGLAIGGAPEAEPALVEEAIAAARHAQVAWSELPANSRAAPLRAMAKLVRERLPELARLVAIEQGKLLPLAEMEAFVTAEYLEYMAEWGRRIEGEVIASDRPGETMLLFRKPLGVVAGIVPWNFPLFMVARKLAPALITGNAIVVKPSEETPYSAHALAKIAAEAGVPDGIFNLVGGSAKTGEALVAHRGIDMISFTGSSAAGTKIMASAATNLTKVNLELGGKAPAIVMDDADLDLAAGVLRASKALNSGQACNCAERIYVHEKVADAFKEKLATAMATIQHGDPLGDAPVDMGPLINRAAVERISDMVEDARRGGAQVLAGGEADSAGGGFHYRATVLADTTDEMAVMKRELFGPVVMVNPVADLDEAIAKANASEYGLTSSIFTNGLNTAMRAIRQLRFGETYVNRENFEAIQGFHAGVRKSGIGGTDGKHGLYEYTHTQVAYIQS